MDKTRTRVPTLLVGLMVGIAVWGVVATYDANIISNAEIEEAEEKCAAMGRDLIGHYGTKDDEIGRLIMLECVMVEDEPNGMLL